VVANGVLYITDESDHLTAYSTAPFVSLAPSPAPPSPVGTPITWTATAAGGIPPLQYAFYLYTAATNTWALARAYSTTSTWSWTPAQAGQYAVQVWVRNNGSAAAYDAWAGYPLFSITNAVPSVTLAASPTLPQQAGTAITWTAAANGGTPPLQYAFYLYTAATNTWMQTRAYSTTNTWVWTPSQTGTYTVQVWVRNNGSVAAYDAWAGSGSFTITSSGGPLIISSFSATPLPPQKAGTTMVWTAMATGGVAPLQYALYLYSSSTNSWTLAQAYSTSNTWSWTPAQAGTYEVQVWVRNNGSGNPFDAWKGSGTLTITP
jgi:hypothetical protein